MRTIEGNPPLSNGCHKNITPFDIYRFYDIPLYIIIVTLYHSNVKCFYENLRV